MARALVTGAAGFVGQHLCRALLGRDWDVVGTALGPVLADGPPAAPSGAPVLAPEEASAISWAIMDVRRTADVRRVVADAAPDLVIHLAAVSFIPGAANDPGSVAEINVAGTARLLGEVRAQRLAGAMDPVVLLIGSAEQYGRHDPSALPLPETAEQRPLSVYGATKAAQEALALQAVRAEGMRVVLTRSFNHSGAGQAPHFLLPALVRRTLAVRDEAAPRLQIGNQDTVRDFLHVTDVANAYISLAERGVAGEAYNVCSGRGRTVRELALAVQARLGIPAELVSEAALVRPGEVPALVGDNTKLRATGWRPTLTTDDIIDDLIHAATR
jgi:GDP-4-dehydro-6-deoxy-D-mannose reductase